VKSCHFENAGKITFVSLERIEMETDSGDYDLKKCVEAHVAHRVGTFIPREAPSPISSAAPVAAAPAPSAFDALSPAEKAKGFCSRNPNSTWYINAKQPYVPCGQHETPKNSLLIYVSSGDGFFHSIFRYC
jgi:hypothetical protein